MKKKHLFPVGIIALAILGIVLWYLGSQPGRTARKGAPSGDVRPGGVRMAPAFTLADINGNVVSSSQLRGKPTVLNFFATWCPPCRSETPGFVEVYNKYRERGLEFIGISLDTDTRGSLPAFVMSNRIGYRILIGDIPTAQSFGGVSSIPTTFFIGKDGEIKQVKVGFLDREELEREVLRIL